MELKYKVLLVLVVTVGAYSLGRYTAPSHTITKTEVKEVVKIVKDTTVSRQNDRQEHIITTKYPDGKVVTERFILNKDTVYIEKKIASESETSTKVEKETIFKKSEYAVGAMAETKLSDLKPIYGAMVEKRILGPVFVGLYGKTDMSFGATIKLEL